VSRDSNKTREEKNRRKAIYKAAFVEVLGDPWQEDCEGAYNILSRRSAITVVESQFGLSPTTPNAARPLSMDFFCDVESVLHEVLDDMYSDGKPALERFKITYGNGDIDDPDALSGRVGASSQRNIIEQKIGKLLWVRGISPVKKYFSAKRYRLPRGSV
jgi:hypothetical protein